MPITNYPLYSERVLPGTIASLLSCDIVSRLNNTNAVIPYGAAVVYDDTGADDAIKLPSAITDVFAGIAVRTYIYEDEAGGIASGKQFDVCLKGEIAVFAEEAVSVGDPVYFRAVAKGTNTILGRFRNDVDATADPEDTCILVANAHWVKGTTGPGTAILRLNEV